MFLFLLKKINSCVFLTNWRLHLGGKHIPLNSYRDKSEWSEVTQSCLTLCDPVDCSPPGSSVHGILQARILEWVAISFSRGFSRTWVSCRETLYPLSHQGSHHSFLFIYFPFIFTRWKLITLQYWSGFCHTLTWISHGVTCILDVWKKWLQCPQERYPRDRKLARGLLSYFIIILLPETLVSDNIDIHVTFFLTFSVQTSPETFPSYPT